MIHLVEFVVIFQMEDTCNFCIQDFPLAHETFQKRGLLLKARICSALMQNCDM